MRNHMNRVKKWMISTLVTICILFVLVAALVIYVDPFFQYHAPLEDFPYLVDNQLSQNPGMAKHMEYDSVILGSSMTVNFNTDWFEELMGLDTIKLNYSGAYPKDQANIMDIIFDSGHQVDAVFLGVDVMTYQAVSTKRNIRCRNIFTMTIISMTYSIFLIKTWC